VTADILRTAREHLAADGAAAISLRAVARDLGMPSSGIYRYFATRDELLTRLIIDAYNALGDAVERSQGPVPAERLHDRFAAACRAVRKWALEHPHEYGLIFGSPVPGYRAPEDTVGPANRIPAVMGEILVLAAKQKAGKRSSAQSLTKEGRAALEPTVEFFHETLPASTVQLGLMIWAALFGTISFEVFGHLKGIVGEREADRDAFFEECIHRWAAQVGVSLSAARS
jgi:AcrR family transcriptional regulator